MVCLYMGTWGHDLLSVEAEARLSLKGCTAPLTVSSGEEASLNTMDLRIMEELGVPSAAPPPAAQCGQTITFDSPIT